HHVAILDDVFLAFVTGLAGFLGGDFAAERDEIVVGDGLGADAAGFEIGADDAGGLGGLGAHRDGPGAGCLEAEGEIGLQVQELVALADQAVEAGLFEAERGEVVGAIGIVETGEFGFDFGADHHHAGILVLGVGFDLFGVLIAGGGGGFIDVADIEHGL